MDKGKRRKEVNFSFLHWAEGVRNRRLGMGRFCVLYVLVGLMVLVFSSPDPSLSFTAPAGESPLADTVYTDDFNRPGPDLGAVWTEDPAYQIVSDEVTNTDSLEAFDDIAVFNPVTNPIGVSFRWGTGVDPAGIEKAGLALMLDANSTSANGYFLFRKAAPGDYYGLWTIENGIVTRDLGHSAISELPFFQEGDEFQVAISSDAQGHHFDIFINGQFDIRFSDPNKLQGNAPILYSGILLTGGALNQNVDDFTFWQYSEDVTPPEAVDDLAFASSTANSITLVWTAPGDDGATGTASRYDVRYATWPISPGNFSMATPATGEPVPSPAGTEEQFTVTGLASDTQYYFALQSDDGFPQRNFSSISNTVSATTQDNIAPLAVYDLTVASNAGSRTALLQWTATGDNDTSGVASSYDVRYSNSPITESSFSVASLAIGEPAPQANGSAEEYSVSGLNAGTVYYYALKVIDEAGNASSLSNIPMATTSNYPTMQDDFERAQLGPDWNADLEFVIEAGELSNSSNEELWDFMAVLSRVGIGEENSMRWGSSANSQGISEAGLALMLNAASPDASGYLIFRHSGLNRYELYTIEDGAPSSWVASSSVSSLPYPGAGDVFAVVVSTDQNGHHFDCYINGAYDTRVSDPLKQQGNGGSLWSGVMLHGNRSNNVEDFWVMGPNANVAPDPFSLVSPADGETVETGVPILDWEDAADPNPSDSVLYALYYGTSAVFDSDSTTVVNDLSESEYTIPPMSLVTLAGGRSQSISVVAENDVVKGLPGRRLADRSPVVMSIGGEGSLPEPAVLPDNVVIYWKVKAYDTGGLETMSLQEDWSFTVSIPDPPLPFSLLSPANGTTVETRTPTLSWEATTDPDPLDVVTYTLMYDEDPGFGSPVEIAGLNETTFSTPLLLDNTWYYWKVLAVDSDDLWTESDEAFSFFVLVPTGIGEGGGELPLPKVFALSQNYPNPFNPSTSIRFDIPEAVTEQGADVRLQVYTLRGQLVRTLVDGVREPGSYVVHWDGRDEQGTRAGSGIYLYTIQAGTFNATRKMMILK